MKVDGRHDFAAAPAAVFAAICDAQVLMTVIPGCDTVREVRPGEYEGIVHLRLPGAAGRYRTTVRLVDVSAPDRAGLEGRVEGAMGSIVGRADFVLRPRDGGTHMDYTGGGVIQGPLARLDSRFAERLAESLIEQGLSALDARLTTEVAA